MKIHETIMSNFKNIKKLPLSQTGYLHYEIMTKDFSFYEAFNILENDLKRNNKIEDFTITQCSLDQIFLYFSKFQRQELILN